MNYILLKIKYDFYHCIILYFLLSRYIYNYCELIKYWNKIRKDSTIRKKTILLQNGTNERMILSNTIIKQWINCISGKFSCFRSLAHKAFLLFKLLFPERWSPYDLQANLRRPHSVERWKGEESNKTEVERKKTRLTREIGINTERVLYEKR